MSAITIPHPGDFRDLEGWLAGVVKATPSDQRISDMTVQGGYPVHYRTPRGPGLGSDVIDIDTVTAWIDGLPNHVIQMYNESSDAPARIELTDETLPIRYVRLHLWRTSEGPTITMRLQPRIPRTFTQLGGPKELLDLFLSIDQGTILFGGPVRSGKTWLIHGLLEELNQRGPYRDVVVIGDPPEFGHKRDKVAIRNREIGFDTPSYASAIRGGLRQNAAVFVASELRGDVETSRAFLQMSQVSCIAMAAIHVATTYDLLERVITPFPDGERSDVRLTLKQSLKAILTTRLVPTIEGDEILATELLQVNSQNSGLLKDPVQLRGAMEGKRASTGCWLLEDDLSRLVRETRITPETAKRYANDLTRLKLA